MKVAFTIPVCPKSLQFSGKRVMVRNGKPVFFKTKKAVWFIDLVALFSKSHLPPRPCSGPIRMSVVYVLERPQALSGQKHPQGRIAHTKRPDCDNLQKGVQDALKGFWEDDAQICDLHIVKFYAAKGESPKIEISIESIDESLSTSHRRLEVGNRPPDAR
jgi:Holliday junction resolvase RusA-like endonuclease